jgi:hypothetical protein
MKVKQYKFWRADGAYYFEWQKTENKSCVIKLDMVQQSIFFEDLLKEAGYKPV